MAEQVEYVVIGLGGLGSATAYQLARRGADVVGLEQFELGHLRGGSHDTSRILRHSYHTPGYVRLTFDAYADWAALSVDAGEELVTVVGGVDLFPPGAAIPLSDYADSLSAEGVDFAVLAPEALAERWPQFRLPAGTLALVQEDAAIVPAARGTAAMQRLAHAYGARLCDQTPVTGVRDLGSSGVEVTAGSTTYRCRRLVVCADAWTNQVLAGVGCRLPLTVTQEQVTYFAPPRPEDFAPGRLPLWIWMDDPSFYGFPCYGEPTVKAAQDCGGPVVTATSRSFDPDPARRDLLAHFLARLLPGSGAPVRSKTCLYTLPPDRDFLLGPVPGCAAVLVGLGAGHGFKFAPTFGRLLADLAMEDATSADIAAFALDRPALLEPAQPQHWLV
jgi:sarcosine oxidase